MIGPLTAEDGASRSGLHGRHDTQDRHLRRRDRRDRRSLFLAVEHGVENVVLVESGNPLSLTSDKSTEAYRNWWPGPDWEMTAFMNRSIDLIEGIARTTENRINLNRRGYVFATADTSRIGFLESMVRLAESRGGGAARFHDARHSTYVPSP
jgi:glycine/D-amino acid oxidase-like deaminating enzyme